MAGNYINYIKDIQSEEISETICNNMKIYIFLEIYDFIIKDDNYEYFKILFFNFIKKIKPIKELLYINDEYYRNSTTNIENLDNKILLDKLLENIDKNDYYKILIKELHEIISTNSSLSIDFNTYDKYKNIYYNKKLGEFDYITFLIIYELLNQNDTTRNDNKIILKYYTNNINNLLNVYYLLYLNFNKIYNKEQYLSHIIKILKCVFLTNYIDIKNIYAITCLNIYLYEIDELNTKDKKEKEIYNDKKAQIILKLLARLLLVTNTFYLNNYTNTLIRNYDTSSINNFIKIFNTIISKVELNNFFDFKKSFYDDTKSCTDDKPIEYILDEDIIITNKFHQDLIRGGQLLDIENYEDELTINNPTYLLNHTPMNYCKLMKLNEFIDKELDNIE
jgi:hypothetical protein